MRSLTIDNSLEGIAGKPAFNFIGASSGIMPAPWSLPVGGAVSMYTVVKTLAAGDVSLSPPVVQIGDQFGDMTANTFSILRVTKSTSYGTRSWQVRRTSGVGPSGQSAAPGAYVIGWGNDAAGMQYMHVGGPRITDTVPMQHASSFIQVLLDASTTHVRTVGYPVAHSDAVTMRIRRWLAATSLSLSLSL